MQYIVSFIGIFCKRDLRPIVLRSLLIVATPILVRCYSISHSSSRNPTCTSVCVVRRAYRVALEETCLRAHHYQTFVLEKPFSISSHTSIDSRLRKGETRHTSHTHTSHTHSISPSLSLSLSLSLSPCLCLCVCLSISLSLSLSLSLVRRV